MRGHDVFIHEKNMIVICGVKGLMFIVYGWPGDGVLGPGSHHGLYPTSDLCTPAPSSLQPRHAGTNTYY